MNPDPDLPWYRQEPWAAALVASFALILAALFVPAPTKLALVALGGLAFLAGVVLLVRKEMARRRSRP